MASRAAIEHWLKRLRQHVMRHPLPLSERINWRLIIMLIGLLGLFLAAAIYTGGMQRPSLFGPDWECPPNATGSSTVCIKDVTKKPPTGG